MATANRFALLCLEDGNGNEKKSSKQSDKKAGGASKSQSAAKKTARRKKAATAAKGAPSVTITEEEIEKRLAAIQDLSYEEAIQEAIINSKITYEEEHARQPDAEFEVLRGKSRKKKPQTAPVGTRGRHGVTMSLAEFQAAEYSNGSFVKPVPNREPSPPAMPHRTSASTATASHPTKEQEDLFQSSQREARRMLEAEKRHEDLKKRIRSGNFDPQPHGDVEDMSESIEEPPEADPSALRQQCLDLEHELMDLRLKFDVLQHERDELHRYFQITENKTAAQLANEMDKLRRLNAELNNNLVETCIELEKQRSRVHELEKNMPNKGGRTQRNSENEW